MKLPSKEVADIYIQYGLDPQNTSQPRTILNIGNSYNYLHTKLDFAGYTPNNAFLCLKDNPKGTTIFVK